MDVLAAIAPRARTSCGTRSTKTRSSIRSAAGSRPNASIFAARAARLAGRPVLRFRNIHGHASDYPFAIAAVGALGT